MYSILFIRGGGEGAYEADAFLAVSLQKALGTSYDVRYPMMPLQEDAGYLDWKAHIASELGRVDEPIILVAHSVGGAILLKFLAEERIKLSIAGLYLISVPYFGGDKQWEYEELTLQHGWASKLSGIPRIVFYHSRDDEEVPFAHLSLYAAKLPQAILREFDGRGHQFRNDLTEVARDIKQEDI